MRKIFLLAILAGAVLSSCSKENDSVASDKQNIKIVAKLADETATKTSMDETGKVVWNVKEAINVFNDKGVSAKFVSTNTESEATVEFTGNLAIDKGTQVYGLYPYSGDATCASGVITTTLPHEQTAVEGAVADGLLITIGATSSEDMSMSFYNVCSGLRFKVFQPGVKKVTVEAIGGEAIAGTFKVKLNKDIPEVQGITAGQSSITLMHRITALLQ